MNLPLRLTVLGVLSVLTLGLLWGQADANKGQIVGTVFDPNKAVVPNATVKIKNVATGLLRESRTNEEGLFRAVLLDPGTYEVTVEAPGFAASVFQGVVVNVGSAVNLHVALDLGTVTQTVEVGESVVQVDSSSPQALISTTAIRDLPINGRRFHDFATMTPSVQIDSQRGSISFAGQRGINGNVMVDGTDYNNPFFGGTRGGERSGFVFTVPQSSIQEFQVVATGYSAEYGRSTGGILNAISKSGSNDYHGEAFYQLRHKEMSMKTPFKVATLETLQQFGGGVGGPIKRDKLFWFAAAERQLSKMPRRVLFPNLDATAPTAATQEAYSYLQTLQVPFQATNDATAVTGRGDYSLSSGSRLTLRFNFSDAAANNAITTGPPPDPLTPQSLGTTGSEKDRTYTGVAQHTWILTPHIANDLRFSGTYELRPRTANVEGPGVTGGSFFTLGSRNFLPTVQDDSRFQINDGISLQIGAHTLKFGGDYNKLHTFQRFGFNQFGTFAFSSTSDLNNLLRNISIGSNQNRFDNTNVRYFRQIGNLIADYGMHQIAFYAQDNWRISPEFQISYGLRWEGQRNPDPVATNATVVGALQAATLAYNTRFDPTTLHDNMKQFMPRFGVTYSPAAFQNRLVVRGFTGIFYAATPMLVFGGTTNNFRIPPGDLSVSYIPASGGVTVYRMFQNIGIDLNQFTLDKLPIIPADDVTRAIAGATGQQPNPFSGANFTGTANNFENPRAFQAGLGADYELTRGLVVGSQFTYVNTVHLERNRDYNLPAPTVRAADGRPVFVRANRPLPQYGQITLRESSARSMYRAMILSAQYRASRRFNLGAFYTLSEAFSDDDNERSAGGFTYTNPFNLRDEYGYSSNDIRHQFAGHFVYSAPYGISVSSTARFLSGRPIDPGAGADANGDGSSSDRAYRAVGVPFERNSFRNVGLRFVDFRVLKDFPFAERYRLQFSAEMFNLFDFNNVVVGGTNLTYGLGVDAAGATLPPRDTVASAFRRLTLPNGNYDTQNTQVGTPFQAQFGLRLFF